MSEWQNKHQAYLELMFARLGRRRWVEYIDGENLSISHKQSQQNVKASHFWPTSGGFGTNCRGIFWVADEGGSWFHAPLWRIGVLSGVMGLADGFRLRVSGCPVGETRMRWIC